MSNKSTSDASINCHREETKNSYSNTDRQHSACVRKGQLKSWANVETVIESIDMRDSSDYKECTVNKQIAEDCFLLRFNEVVPLIAQTTEAGFVCFMNPDSLELEPVPGKMLDNPETFYEASGGVFGKKRYNHLHWQNCYMFEPVPEKELLKLVEAFMKHLAGQRIHDKLNRLLMKKKPYAKLNALITRSKHSGFWMEFKKKHIEKLVKDELNLVVNN